MWNCVGSSLQTLALTPRPDINVSSFFLKTLLPDHFPLQKKNKQANHIFTFIIRIV